MQLGDVKCKRIFTRKSWHSRRSHQWHWLSVLLTRHWILGSFCVLLHVSAVITDLDEMSDVPCASCPLIYRGPSSANRRFRIFRVSAHNPPPPTHTHPTQQYQAKRIQRRYSGMQATWNLWPSLAYLSWVTPSQISSFWTTTVADPGGAK